MRFAIAFGRNSTGLLALEPHMRDSNPPRCGGADRVKTQRGEAAIWKPDFAIVHGADARRRMDVFRLPERVNTGVSGVNTDVRRESPRKLFATASGVNASSDIGSNGSIQTEETT